MNEPSSRTKRGIPWWIAGAALALLLAIFAPPIIFNTPLFPQSPPREFEHPYDRSESIPLLPEDDLAEMAKRRGTLSPVASRAEPVVPVAAAARGNTTAMTKVIAQAGMRYDDPWLRAMIITPSLMDAMTATPYGTPDLTELRNLMRKPNWSLMLSFNEDPYLGMTSDRFQIVGVFPIRTWKR
jgi:hypothetical protein